MSKHSITHACGHTVTHQLYGPHLQRDYKMARMAEEPCQACQEQRQIDAAYALFPGLPTLKGSDKQIAWADKIRARHVQKLAVVQLQVNDVRDQDPDTAAACDAIIREHVYREDASAWIDTRDTQYGWGWLQNAYMARHMS